MDMRNNDRKPIVELAQLPTRRQLQRSVSQNFASFYRQRVGCSPQKVTCTIFANYLVIIAEKAITPVEETIKETGQIEIIFEIRQGINKILKSQLKKLVEELVMVEVIDLICGHNFESGRVMAIAVLIRPPQVRGRELNFDAQVNLAKNQI